MSHRRQLYHPLVYLFCILIRSGSRFNAIAKQTEERNEESTSSVSILFDLFDITYFTSSLATIPEYQPLSDPKAKEGDITRQGFHVTEGLIFWYVTLEAMWYMYYIYQGPVSFRKV